MAKGTPSGPPLSRPGGGSGYRHSAFAESPRGRPTLEIPPPQSDGLGPIVRLPNGLFGFSRYVHSSPGGVVAGDPAFREPRSSNRGLSTERHRSPPGRRSVSPRGGFFNREAGELLPPVRNPGRDGAFERHSPKWGHGGGGAFDARESPRRFHRQGGLREGGEDPRGRGFHERGDPPAGGGEGLNAKGAKGRQRGEEKLGKSLGSRTAIKGFLESRPTLQKHLVESPRESKPPPPLETKATQTRPEEFASPSLARQLDALAAHPLYRLCFTEMPKKDPERAHWAADFRLGLGSTKSELAVDGTREESRREERASDGEGKSKQKTFWVAQTGGSGGPSLAPDHAKGFQDAISGKVLNKVSTEADQETLRLETKNLADTQPQSSPPTTFQEAETTAASFKPPLSDRAERPLQATVKCDPLAPGTIVPVRSQQKAACLVGSVSPKPEGVDMLDSRLEEIGTIRDERSCALCGVGSSRVRGDWYCATCGRRDEACVCTRPLRANGLKSRKYAAKYLGAKAVVHRLCAFWTPSVYQPGDGEAFMGLTKAVIDSTGSPNHGGKKLTPVRCSYCHQVGATSRCRVESSCHAVYHYTCAVAAGCRMHDCLENSGLSIACPEHFHVSSQVRKGSPALPPRQLPLAAALGAKKQTKTPPKKGAKKTGGKKRPAEKPPLTVPARKSTVRRTGEMGEQKKSREDLLGGEEERKELGLSDRAFRESPRKQGEGSQAQRRVPEPAVPSGELAAAEGRSDTPLSPNVITPGRASRELRSLLADVPRPGKAPTFEAQLRSAAAEMRKKQKKKAWYRSQRLAILEKSMQEPELVAQVQELAPGLYRLARRLVEGGVNWDEVTLSAAGSEEANGDGVNGRQESGNGHQASVNKLKAEADRHEDGSRSRAGQGVPHKDPSIHTGGLLGRAGQPKRVAGAAEVARKLGSAPKTGVEVVLGNHVGQAVPTILRPTPLKLPESDQEGGARRGRNGQWAGQKRGRSELGQDERDRRPGKEQRRADQPAAGSLGWSAQFGVPAFDKNLPIGGAPAGAHMDELGLAFSEPEAEHAEESGEGTELVEPTGGSIYDDVSSANTVELEGVHGGPDQGEPSEDTEVVGTGSEADGDGISSCSAPNVSAQANGREGDGLSGAVSAGAEVARKRARSHGSDVMLTKPGMDGGPVGGSGPRNEGVDDDRPSSEAGLAQRIDEPVFECAACGAVGSVSRMKAHHALPAVLCEECVESVNSANFSDRCKAGVERHCQLCGGREKKRPQCDGCCKTVCQRCLGRILGPEKQHALEDADFWQCFTCDVAQLEGVRSELRRFQKAKEELEGRENGTGLGMRDVWDFTKKTAGLERPGEGCDPGLVKGSQNGLKVSSMGDEGGNGKLEHGLFACAACGVTKEESQKRLHPSLPVAVCQGCSAAVQLANFADKDVRGWERQCQLCGTAAAPLERRRCEGCCRAACDKCVGRILGARMLESIRGGVPWLCFSCDTEQLEEAGSGPGGSDEGPDWEGSAAVGPGQEEIVCDADKVSNSKKLPDARPDEVLIVKHDALGIRCPDGIGGPGEGVSEAWGFCQCGSCADRFTGKKDANSKLLAISPDAKSPSKKSRTRPWAAYSRVGARLISSDVSGGREKVPIPFTNDVDDDVSPLEMDYITELRLHPDLADFHERFEPAGGCSGCGAGDADDSDAPLSKHVRDLELFEGYALRTAEDDQRIDWQRERMHGRLPYDENCLLVLPPELHPTIIECNARCPCWPHCPNSTLQRGPSVHLELFKTDNGRGFGVRTREDIQRGRLIGQYVGEVITSEEANGRNSVYLFNMDHHVRSAEQQDEVYVVDGGPASSIIRYINHSCDPNLAIYSVYTDTLHPGKPLLALYAIKDIVAGAELGYDYMYGDPGQASPGSADGQIECKCGSSNCQKWLPDPTSIKSEHQD